MAGIAGFKVTDEVGRMIDPIFGPEEGFVYGGSYDHQMHGAFWRARNAIIWCIQRDEGRSTDLVDWTHQTWLIRSVENGSWWKWRTHKSVAANTVKAVGDDVLIGCHDGHIRYYSERRGADTVAPKGGTRQRQAYICYYGSSPISNGDGAQLSLEEVEVQGDPGTPDVDDGLVGNTYPGPNAHLYARSDFGDWKFMGEVELTEKGKVIPCMGKNLNAGEFLEIRLYLPTDYAGPEITKFEAGIKGLGQNIPKDS
jgi:hypothetical protein